MIIYIIFKNTLKKVQSIIPEVGTSLTAQEAATASKGRAVITASVNANTSADISIDWKSGSIDRTWIYNVNSRFSMNLKTPDNWILHWMRDIENSKTKLHLLLLLAGRFQRIVFAHKLNQQDIFRGPFEN